ncbi:MAG: PDZ domain-containing protein [Alphaproteobacteria bacterium]|jgi:carboxyl-terminal processing protease|nr:PDZ domain-containing protein [Alphaproteobacteria bacterium]
MLKRVVFFAMLIFLSINIVHIDKAQAWSFDFFGLLPRSDKFSDSFLDEFKHALPNAGSQDIRTQTAIFREAYFLLLDNYIYEINDAEKEKIANKAKEALRTVIDKLTMDKKPITPQAVMEGVMTIVFNDIDAHTVFMSTRKAEEFRANLTGNHKGIGILFNFDKTKNMIYVVKVFNQSPAQKSGILDGDYIKAVDGNTIDPKDSLDKVLDAIRGPNGTKVKLTVIRGDKTFDVEVIRGDYYVPSVESRIIDGKFAYININSFNQDTASLFRSAINSLQVNKLQGLVIDVRNNPGGLLTAVVIIADTLLSGETIVSIKGRDTANNQSFLAFNATQVREDLPVVILINSSSASASELLAGAMALNNRATLMGDSTFGKWSVQSSFTLADKSIFNITTQLFYSPKDATFQGTGIAPDIKIIGENQKTFRERDYKNYLKVPDVYKRSPKLQLQEKQCPPQDKKDYVLGCAILFLQANADIALFKNKVGNR